MTDVTPGLAEVIARNALRKIRKHGPLSAAGIPDRGCPNVKRDFIYLDILWSLVHAGVLTPLPEDAGKPAPHVRFSILT